jgi:hypothetical protein
MTDPYIAKRDDFMRQARDVRRIIRNAQPGRRPHLLHLVPALVAHARKHNHYSIRYRKETIDTVHPR